MVPKKHLSKRVPAARRYKVEKNVRQHKRRVAKEARKNPQPKRKEVDPGIPNAWPFKEELLLEVEQRKLSAEEEKRALKEQRKEMAVGSLEDLVADAARRGEEYDAGMSQFTLASSSSTVDRTAAGLRDNSKKAYYKEFRKVVENADVILEVLDARDPLGCRTKKIEEMILQSGRNKRVVLVLNKIDLVPRAVVEKWLKHLRNEYPTVAFKASTQQQRTNLGVANVSTSVASDRMLNSAECLGADQLIQLLKNYSRSLGLKTAISVGVIGYPNVGKSSVINSLKRSKVCGVGATPGHTKATQEIALDKNLKLIDCPGIVFSQSAGTTAADAAEAILRNCVKVELLDDAIAPVEVILKRCKMEQLMGIYEIPPFGDVNDFLVNLARQKGRLRKGGIPDVQSAARSVLQDWNSGKIPYYTLPPTAEENKAHLGAAVVPTWGAEFKVDEVEDDSILTQVPEEHYKFVRAAPGNSEVDMDAVPAEQMDEQMDDSEAMDDDHEESDDDDNCPDALALDDDSVGAQASDDDAEDMEAESTPTFHVTAELAPKSRAKSTVTLRAAAKSTARQVLPVVEAELELNQQSGKALKRRLKKEKKLRQLIAGGVEVDAEGDAEMDEDSYDFGEFYHK